MHQSLQSVCRMCGNRTATGQGKNLDYTHQLSLYEEIHEDFLHINIHCKKYEFLNIMDLGTKYGERTLATSRTADQMKNCFESQWFYNHGAPKRFSADHEFWGSVLQRFLTLRNVSLNPRPSPSSHKTVRIERNNGLFKALMDRMEKAV